ncbi:MAG: helix-turn-helix domain-containing protein [Thermoguttaceae bacterium]|jgi:DNA-binding transcriptional regulator YiaG|nr:helix-turn-helix domain-containing protein [Thermoguttaceae bacterium]
MGHPVAPFCTVLLLCQRILHRSLGVDCRGVKDWHRAVIGSNQQTDLRAAQDNSLGSPPHEVPHDLAVPFLGHLVDLPETQFVVDDLVNIEPIFLGRDHDLDSVLLVQINALKSQQRKHIAKPQADEEAVESARFSSKSVRSQRRRLGLSAADYAKLVGVSPLTIYNWEKGKNRPKAAQLAALVAVRGIGKREALQRLEAISEEE